MHRDTLISQVVALGNQQLSEPLKAKYFRGGGRLLSMAYVESIMKIVLDHHRYYLKEKQ